MFFFQFPPHDYVTICVFIVTFNVAENVKWIKINAHQSGYYRVLYNENNWANIIEDLSNDPNKFSSQVGFYLIFYHKYGRIFF